MLGEGNFAIDEEVVGEELEAAARGDGRIEDADGADVPTGTLRCTWNMLASERTGREYRARASTKARACVRSRY